MRVTARGMPAPLVVLLPQSALTATQRPAHPDPGPAPAGRPAQPPPHASEAASSGAHSGASLGAAQPGRLRLGRTRSGAAEPASPGLRSARSGAEEPPSPCFSASSRSSTDSRICQAHLNPVLWPRARRPLQTLNPVSRTADPDSPCAEPLNSFGGATAREAVSIAEKGAHGAAGDQQLRTIRVCADSVCGLQVRAHAALLFICQALLQPFLCVGGAEFCCTHAYTQCLLHATAASFQQVYAASNCLCVNLHIIWNFVV